MANTEAHIRVEVVYAKPSCQRLVALELPAGATVAQALHGSGLLEEFPEIDLRQSPVGIFGRPCTLARTLKSGDRVEIYRRLEVDPKAARRLAAQRGGSGASSGGSGSSRGGC